MSGRWFAAGAVVAALLVLGAAPASAQMPDPKQMNGMSMPSADLPNGTLSVRVIRGQMTNNLSGVPVTLTGAGAPRTVQSGADGRAIFSELPVGSTVVASATVDGERMETQPIEVPAQGGVRSLLVFSEKPGDAASGGANGAGGPASGAAPGSGAPGSAASGGPATTSSGSLSIGGNSRLAVEFADDVLQVFYLLEIVNRGQQAVSPPSALVFDMPTGAEGVTILEGSTRQANAKGTRVTVTGPFQPGATPLQIAFRMDSFGSSLSLDTKFPLPLDLVAVAVQKIGDMSVTSPQLSRVSEAPLSGQTFVMGTGPGVAAGTPLQIALTGLPYHSQTGVYLAVALAAAIIAAGVWLSWTPGGGTATAARRRELEKSREKGLAALAALEQERAANRIDTARYASRRASLLGQLERVYGELDGQGGPAGGQGAAA